MPISVTEDLLRAIATKEKAISEGRTIAKKGAYKNTKKTSDDSLLWGQCQGSALYADVESLLRRLGALGALDGMLEE